MPCQALDSVQAAVSGIPTAVLLLRSPLAGRRAKEADDPQLPSARL